MPFWCDDGSVASICKTLEFQHCYGHGFVGAVTPKRFASHQNHVSVGDVAGTTFGSLCVTAFWLTGWDFLLRAKVAATGQDNAYGLGFLVTG